MVADGAGACVGQRVCFDVAADRGDIDGAGEHDAPPPYVDVHIDGKLSVNA